MRDALSSFPWKPGMPKMLLYVIHHDRHTTLQYDGIEVISVSHAQSIQDRMALIRQHMTEMGVGFVLLQLVGLAFLRTLWEINIQTGIIFQNEEPTWSYSPSELQRGNVPFLLATFGSMANRLRLLAPTIPVYTIWPKPDVPTQPANRFSMRRRWEVPEGAVLLGMVGAFKLHKRYTLAVRILKSLRDRHVDAYLCIVGGHSERYGGGQQAYEATIHLARRLGVADRLRCLGEVKQAEELCPSFDLFLNTSLYEGLSRATLSAVTQGCPVLATAVGGIAEILSPPNRAISADASPTEFADAALSCLDAGWQEPSGLGSICSTQAEWGLLWQKLLGDCRAPETEFEVAV
jgi:glycosyltransferase involved in cell wall biosynthesis